MLRKSLQTITWGDPQHHQFGHIFELASRAGFDGVEIGFRRLGQVSIDAARDLLRKNNLMLSASHVGGNLVDLTQASNERAAVEKVLDYLTELNSKYLIYSGLNIDNNSDLDAEIVQVGNLADHCAKRNIELLYHNHDWEFANDRHIWDRLRAAAIGSLGFAPDLGWAVKSGQDLHAILSELGPAVKILHFKDFHSWEAGQNTCHLGSGIIDFSPAWAWLEEQAARELWITAEQDEAVDNDQACLTNGAYLATQIAERGL